MDYQLIPEDAQKIELYTWGCGDECRCKQHQIIASTVAHHNVGHRPILWEGQWMSFSDGVENPEEIMAELKSACLHYGLPFDESWDVGDYLESHRDIQ